MDGFLDETTAAHIREGGHAIIDYISNPSSVYHELDSNDVLTTVSPARLAEPIAAPLLEVLGANVEKKLNPRVRGDSARFVESVRDPEEFEKQFPTLLNLVNEIITMGKLVLNESPHHDSSSLVPSVQVACYPGDGCAEYPRHCDVSYACTKGDKRAEGGDRQRLLTAIYYINEDWNPEENGGSLRLFLASDTTEAMVDVAPLAGRLVLFRSDKVPHQVLPSNGRTRWAVTVWLYKKQSSDSSILRAVENSSESMPPSPSVEPPPLESPDTLPDATIFVSIASYRDSETTPTLNDLFAKARHPERVFVGLWLQLEDDDPRDVEIQRTLPYSQSWWSDQVRCSMQPAALSAGPCPARAACQSQLYKGEDYFLQIDSHMRFRKNWDSFLLNEIELTPDKYRAILSTYPAGYTLGDNPNAWQMSRETRPTIMVPRNFGPEGMLRQKSVIQRSRLSEPVWQGWVAAGFLMGPGRVIQDVPYNSNLRHLFFGEEISLAVRLFTHGYDVYAPSQQVCNHLWTRNHRPTPRPMSVTAQNEREKSLEIVRRELLGQGDGLGNERSVADFQDRVMVDFGSCVIQKQQARDNAARHISQDAASLILSYLGAQSDVPPAGK